MAAALAASWAPGGSSAWIKAEGGWERHPVERGTWQGSPRSNPVFTLAVHAAMLVAVGEHAADVEEQGRHVTGLGPMDEVGGDGSGSVAGSMRGPADEINDETPALTQQDDLPAWLAAGNFAWTFYADDGFLFGPAGSLLFHLDPIGEAFSSIGLKLNADKGAAYTERCDGASVPTAEPTAEQADLYARLPRAAAPPRVLGAVLQGTVRASMVTEGKGDLEREAVERVRRAAILCTAIREMVAAIGELHGEVLEAAWQLMTRCAARALDFDLRLCPSSEVLSAAKALDHILRQTTACILGRPLTDGMWAQCHLPGPLGGLAVPDPVQAANGAYWASWASTRPLVERLTTELLRMAPAWTDPDSDDTAAAAALAEAGVEVTTDGAATLGQDALAEVNAVPWLRRDLDREEHKIDLRCGARGSPPTHRLMGRIGRLSAQLAAARLWDKADVWDKERLAACGGPKAGSLWAAPLDGNTQLLGNGHWRIASLRRLGGISLPRGLRCACQNKKGAPCGQLLGERGEHLDLCRWGASKLRPHTSMVHALARRCRQSGAHVDVERVVPDMAIWTTTDECIDAVLDVVSWWPGRLQQHSVDCTIRSPHASRYGVCEDITGRAQREKHRRYGQTVWPLATTTYGRVGDEGDALIELLASEARAAGGDDIATQRGAAAGWRRDIERAVQHAIADQVLLALGAAGVHAWSSASRAASSAATDPEHVLSADQLIRIEAARDAAIRRREAKARANSLSAALDPACA